MKQSIINYYNFILFIILIGFLLPGLNAQVVINEICWMGTKASSSDEWIELYNFSQSPVELTGWKLKSSDGTPDISLAGTISAHGYYLLERTDDNAVRNIAANRFYTGALSNTGETLLLINNASTTIDRVNCASSWYAGNNSAKISMERIDPYTQGSDPDNWGNNNGSITNGSDADGNTIKGTPKHKNSIMDQSLPVLVTNFKAHQDNEYIVIRWDCQYQDEIMQFNLYRSQNNKDFIKISEFPIQQNSTAYRYSDNNIKNNGTYFYKLEIKRINGSKKYYGPISINLKKNINNTQHSMLRIFPNPFNPATTLYLTISEFNREFKVTCKIFNCLGRCVRTFSKNITHPGQYQLSWNGCDTQGIPQSSGIYFVKLFSTERPLASSRMLKLK